MIGRLALRSLTAHPIRSAVLAAGFGFGVGVMAILLGVAQVVLDQAQSPQLVGGGDVLVRMLPQVPARLLLTGTLQSDALRSRVRVAAPFHTSALYLLHNGKTTRVDARGGIPTLERATGDQEVEGVAAWQDTDADQAWTHDTPDRVLRQIDRFHPIPDAPEWSQSWAEWLYFNGRSGDTRFYLTFLVGPRTPDGRRAAGVRLQLERNGQMESFASSDTLAEDDVLRAPDLTIGGSSVRLDGVRYRIHLDVAAASGRKAVGDLVVEGSPGRLVPPLEISGARGWVTGYVVPVMSGRLTGGLTVGGTAVALNGTGYHDHNWGFWQGVSWQWGQVQQGDLSFIYGRVFPPRDAADPDHIPGFVGVLGADGPLGYATDVRISETNDAAGKPRTIAITARGPSVDLALRVDIASQVTTHMAQGPLANGVDFLQLSGRYTVTGRAGNRDINFTAPGSAETFRGQPAAAAREATQSR
jgi:hypothetical protein